MRLVLALAALLTAAALPARAENAPSYDALMQTARQAFAQEDWRALADALGAMQELHPYSLFIARNRILAYAMLGDDDRALALVDALARRGLSVELAGHEGFEKLVALPAFAPLADRMRDNAAPKGCSRIAFELDEDGLLPEAVAIDPARDLAFVGSVRTGAILRADGSLFARAPGGVYALAIAGDELIAAASTAAPYEASASAPPEAGLYVYDLSDGGMKSSVKTDGETFLLGALAATPAGVVASDSKTPRLMIWREDAERFDILAEDARFANLQGIAYDAGRDVVFVADYLTGLFSVDIRSRAVARLGAPDDAHLGGVDGLMLYEGSLIGIQNGTTPQRIVAAKLSADGGAVESLTVLAQAQAGWAEPTNGQIAGDILYYVATSNWPAYGADGTLDETAPRAPLRVMTIDLKGGC